MNRPLRIAVLVGTFPVVSETFVIRHIAGLLEAGHEVDIYADLRGDDGAAGHPEVQHRNLLARTTYMDMPPEMAPYEMPIWPCFGRTWLPGSDRPIANWSRLRRALPRWLACFAREPRLACAAVQPSHYGYRARSFSAAWRLYRTLAAKSRRYDLAHAHFGPTGESFRFVRQLWRAPLFVSFHGYDFCSVPRREGSRVYERLFAAADRVTANSEFTDSRLRALGCPAGKLFRWPMGVPADRIPFQTKSRAQGEPLRLLTVARLVPIKGHALALRALSLLPQTAGPFEYHIVGDGPERPALESLAAQLGLAGAVRFHGAADPSALLRHYASCHLFLLTSQSIEGDAEGQGLAVQEAQAAGLPVVVTRHGGLPEGMREGRSGLVVPENDPPALARALADLAAHPERWIEMGRAGRAFVESHFDSPRLLERLLDLYHSTVHLARS